MRDRMEIIDKDTLELMEERLAKPDKSIKKHTEELLEVLDLLYDVTCISLDICILSSVLG